MSNFKPHASGCGNAGTMTYLTLSPSIMVLNFNVTCRRVVQFVDGDPAGAMLFDHNADPHELRNLAHDPAHSDIVAQLQRQLRGRKAGQPVRRAD